MNFRNLLAASAVSAALLFTSPAAAETVRVGATVTDTQGGEVGTIVAVDGDQLTLRTDRHDVRLPVASFRATDETVLYGETRDQLNARVDRLLAQAAQAIQVGAVVHDRDGLVIGPIEAIEGDNLTVRFGEHRILIQRGSVAPAPNGLITGATLAQLRAQVAAAGTN